MGTGGRLGRTGVPVGKPFHQSGVGVDVSVGKGRGIQEGTVAGAPGIWAASKALSVSPRPRTAKGMR